MRKLLFGIVLILFSLVMPAYSADTLECSWELSAETDSFLFYGNDYTTDHLGNIFNSPIYFTSSPQPYHRALNCRSSITSESIEFYRDTASASSCGSDFPFMYFNADINGVGEINYNPAYHTSTLCGKLPSAFSYADVKITNEDKFEALGYECLYRFDSESNARISSCDAQIPGLGEYEYGVWARLFEGDLSLKCSNECTSQLDDRVYSICSTKVSACRNVPTQCDASLLGAWVNINESTQVKCSAPWNEYREDPTYVPSAGNFNLDVRANDDSCASLISQDYSVILDNDVVKMVIYVCGE